MRWPEVQLRFEDGREVTLRLTPTGPIFTPKGVIQPEEMALLRTHRAVLEGALDLCARVEAAHQSAPEQGVSEAEVSGANPQQTQGVLR